MSMTAKSQAERFAEAARALSADESEAAFREKLAAVARHKPGHGGVQSMDQNKVAEIARAESELATLRQLSSDEDNVNPARERNINRLAQRVKQLKAELGL
jgi:hypothetical protein